MNDGSCSVLPTVLNKGVSNNLTPEVKERHIPRDIPSSVPSTEGSFTHSFSLRDSPFSVRKIFN